MRQKQQVFSRQACRAHAAAARRRRQAAVSCHGLLAKRQTHKLVDLYGLNKEIARAQNQRKGWPVPTSTYWYYGKVPKNTLNKVWFLYHYVTHVNWFNLGLIGWFTLYVPHLDL